MFYHWEVKAFSPVLLGGLPVLISTDIKNFRFPIVMISWRKNIPSLSSQLVEQLKPTKLSPCCQPLYDCPK